jgi:hypothetical protein
MLFTRDAVGLACDMFVCYYGFVKKIKEIKKKIYEKNFIIHSIFKKKIIKLNS